MKKLFFSMTVLLILLVSGVYALLFTSWGNGVVASIIEDKANEQPNVNFKVEKFVLTMSDIDFVANVDNNSTIKVQGALYLLAQEFDLTYDVNVKDLDKLNKLTNANLQGTLNTQGSVKGDAKKLRIKGVSDIFDSQTDYDAVLVDFKAQDILFSVKQAKLEQLLYMVKQPQYAKALIDIEGSIKNMQGNIVTTISKGKVNNPLVNDTFNQKLLKPLYFNGEVNTNLTSTQAISKIDFFTTMANLFVQKAVVNLKDASLNSDYLLKVDDLSKLYDVAQMKMRGKVALKGEVKKDTNLLVTGASKLLDGILNFKLLNNDFSSSIKEVEVLKALHMMYYPEVFTSKTNLNLNYNLQSKQGVLDGTLINGQFKQNKYSALLNNFAKFDITKEVYKSVAVKSNINKDIVKSTVDMQSKLTHIQVPSSTIDTKKRLVDALIKTNLKGIKFDTTVSGSLDKPTIKMDTSKLLESAAKEKVKEKIEEKVIEKLGNDAGKLLKGLFQ